MYKYHDYKMRDLQNNVKTASQLHPTDRDPHVKNVLDKYRDTHPARPILLGILYIRFLIYFVQIFVLYKLQPTDVLIAKV